MSYRVYIFPDHCIGLVELNGDVTAEDIAVGLHAMYGHDRWENHWNALWDARSVTSLTVDPEGLTHIADWKEVYRRERVGGLSAILVERDLEAEMALLMARYRETSGRETRVFRDLQDALVFLGLASVPNYERGSLTASSDHEA
jgi:hypothetical protein